jgi:hypothetical protein
MTLCESEAIADEIIQNNGQSTSSSSSPRNISVTLCGLGMEKVGWKIGFDALLKY